MAGQLKLDPLPDAVMVTGKVTWAPPVEVGMACNTSRHGFTVMGRIVEVLDQAKGKVMVLADDGQDSTANQGDKTFHLFTPGQPFRVNWKIGLQAVQRSDGRWEQPVLEVIREKRKAALGWQLSDAVRCDPSYRHKVTGGGIRGEGGRFQGRGERGASVERKRWTTTLRPEALDALRTLAEAHGIDRNEVVERLLLAPAELIADDPGPHHVVVSMRLSQRVADRLKAAAAAAGETPSSWARGLVARVFS